MLERDDVQLVMVALPNFLHEQATVDAASAGKHIFLEKPMADTLEECDRMLAAVERSGVQLLVAHSQRYFASTVRARELLQGGSLGAAGLATDTWYKPFGVEIRLPVVSGPRDGRWHVADERRAHGRSDLLGTRHRSGVGSRLDRFGRSISFPVDDANMACS